MPVKPILFGGPSQIEDTVWQTSASLFRQTGLNTGNSAFNHAVRRITAADVVIPWHQAATLDRHGGIAIMPCANHLGPHDDLGKLAADLRDTSTKLVVLGLGAQGNLAFDEIPVVPQGTLDWLSAVTEHAPSVEPNIAVRGGFTLRTLDRYGFGTRSTVLGCPSLFINPSSTLGSEIEERLTRPIDRIAVAAGHQNWRNLRLLEASLTRLATATGGAYIVQSPFEMVALARADFDAIPPPALEACRDYACPELTIPEFRRWSRQFARVFFGVSAWMEFLRGFDFVIGPRVHGVMLGIQAGIPALCIAHDSRTRELCELMKIPFVTADLVLQGVTRDDLARYFKFDGKAFDANRAMLARRLDDFLESNGLERSPLLRAIYTKS